VTNFVLAEVIAKALIFVDGLLGLFVQDVTWVNTTDQINCTSGALMSNGLTGCGEALLDNLLQITVGGTAFLAGALSGLGVQVLA
jgi:hypothetical protein